MKHVVKALTLALAASLLMAATAFAAPVKIGLMCPLTGKWASEGQDMRNIVTLLADELNKAGGINGNKVDLVVEDDGGDPRTAALAAQKLTTSGVIAAIGTYGSAVTEASQSIYDEAGVVQIATGSTAVRLTEKGLKRFLRTAPRDDEQGMVAAKLIKAKGYKAVALLHDNSSYAKGLADETKALLDKAGTKIVFYDALTPGERDYTAILTKLKAANPDIIFCTGYYPEVGMLLRQKMEMKWNVPMMGGDAANHADLVKISGKEAAKGYFFLSPPGPQDLDAPVAKSMLTAYKAKFNGVPGSVWSVLAGDAFNVIVEAVKSTGKADSGAIADYLKTKLKNYPGFTGQISFNEKGDRVGDLYRVYEVNANGEFILQP
ncbi:MAG: branched-chain amino acid ABC transporter substrate-binding protein [Desulfovibrio sp.]|jgi:branched-chain amino acid transport system substrate-binding protein|nr:branched-chain amino acid ABC transporter substrate-binding protein [Desulfovibrio sp.]